MEKKAGLLLVVFYFSIIFFFKTQASENILLRINDNIFWDKYFELFFYMFFTLLLTISYRSVLVESFRDFIENVDKYLKKGLIVYIITVFIMVITAVILSRFLIGESPNEIAVKQSMENNIVIMSFVTCLIGPFVEEMIFRGILYEQIRNIKDNKLGMYLSIIIVSLLFALYHFDFKDISNRDYKQILVYLPLFFEGIGLSYLYERTNNIFTPLIVHIFLNILASYG